MYGTNSDKGYKVNRMSLRIGIDIGSTTVKVVLLDEQNKLLFRSYERHYSKARERAAETLRSLADRLAGRQVRIVITGSAGLGVAKAAGEKCERCWIYSTELGSDPAHPTLCPRCAKVMAELPEA